MVPGSDLRRGNARALAARLAALTTSAVLALTLTACGDDSGGDATAPTRAAETTAGAGAAPGTTPTGTEGAGPADPAAAEKEIRQNWEKFFDPATPMEDKQDLLEDGDLMGPVLEAFSGDERGQQVEAKVSEVEFTSATEANVTYSLLLKGATALPDSKGTAVEEDGTWKVSVKTLCGLVGLSGNASPLPGC